MNNKPKEKKIVSDNGAWASGSKNLCNDAFEDGEATCGFQRDKSGNMIWDSQVFQLRVQDPVGPVGFWSCVRFLWRPMALCFPVLTWSDDLLFLDFGREFVSVGARTVFFFFQSLLGFMMILRT